MTDTVLRTCNNLIYHPFRISFLITFENLIINLSGAISPKVQPLNASHLLFPQNKNIVNPLKKVFLQMITLSKDNIFFIANLKYMHMILHGNLIPLVKLRGGCPTENEKLEFWVHRGWRLYMKRSETIPASR